jgi:glucose-1-phosphate thymidylyltransferase
MVLKGLIAPPAHSLAAVGEPSAALQRVANRPIVCHVLDAMRQAGVTDIALLVSIWESADLRACVSAEGPAGLDVEYVPFADGAFEQALAAAARLVGEAACVVHAANGLLTQPLAPLLELPREDAPDLVVLVHRQSSAAGSIGLAASRLLRIVGAPQEDRALDLADVCMFGPGALRHAIGVRESLGRELDLVATAERLVARGGRLSIERVDGWRCNTGNVDDLLELNRIALDGIWRELAEDAGTTTAPPAVLGGNRIEGYVDVHPTACVQSSVIVGPAAIGPGAQVLDSYIGPYTSIGSDVRIEGAEVERSIILPGASIMHIGGRLVGSVVGRDARVFRDFSLPRALRLNVGDGGEVSLC